MFFSRVLRWFVVKTETHHNASVFGYSRPTSALLESHKFFYSRSSPLIRAPFTCETPEYWALTRASCIPRPRYQRFALHAAQSLPLFHGNRRLWRCVTLCLSGRGLACCCCVVAVLFTLLRLFSCILSRDTNRQYRTEKEKQTLAIASRSLVKIAFEI